MAVNVDIVYKTVLLILNQQQRGYMTPDEFNKVATQVQLTMFEMYASDLNQQYRVPQNTTEYANRVKNLEEKLEYFQTIGSSTFNTDHFVLPTTSTTPSISQTFVGNPPIDGAASSFTVTNWDVSQNTGALVKVIKDGAAQSSPADYTWDENANILTMTAVPLVGSSITIELYPVDFYRLGTVIYKGTKIAQYVQRNELTQLLLSPLTQPSTNFPLYLYENEKIYVYPTTIQSDITVSYLKKPRDVKWGYTEGALGQYVYAPGTSTPFDLHPSEQTEIIMRILAYAGIIINDPTIVQAAASEVANQVNNEKT